MAMSNGVHTDVCRLSPALEGSTGHFLGFAVGYSCQPLPNGKCFVLFNQAADVRIKATDAVDCYGFEHTKLRPELLEARMAKLPPTATFFPKNALAKGAFMNNSAPKVARIGLEKITNGVKQQLPSMWLLGGEKFLMNPVGFPMGWFLAN